MGRGWRARWKASSLESGIKRRVRSLADSSAADRPLARTSSRRSDMPQRGQREGDAAVRVDAFEGAARARGLAHGQDLDRRRSARRSGVRERATAGLYIAATSEDPERSRDRLTAREPGVLGRMGIRSSSLIEADRGARRSSVPPRRSRVDVSPIRPTPGSRGSLLGVSPAARARCWRSRESGFRSTGAGAGGPGPGRSSAGGDGTLPAFAVRSG